MKMSVTYRWPHDRFDGVGYVSGWGRVRRLGITSIYFLHEELFKCIKIYALFGLFGRPRRVSPLTLAFYREKQGFEVNGLAHP